MSYYKYLELIATVDPELFYVKYLPATARLRYYKNMRRKNRVQNCQNRITARKKKRKRG